MKCFVFLSRRGENTGCPWRLCYTGLDLSSWRVVGGVNETLDQRTGVVYRGCWRVNELCLRREDGRMGKDRSDGELR